MSYAEQRHFVAGIRSMFGCRVQRYATVICEAAWNKLSPAERHALIRHVLKLYESNSVSA